MKKNFIAACCISFLTITIAWAGIIGSGGVKKIVAQSDGSYRVDCNNGASRVVKNKNGWWTNDTGSTFGDNYKHISIEEFARRACN